MKGWKVNNETLEVKHQGDVWIANKGWISFAQQ
jgi:hypothetical protein